MDNVEQNTDSKPFQKKRQYRRKKDLTSAQVGITKNVGTDAANYQQSYYDRRRFLTVPREIKDAHPDKHFVFLNMNKLEKSGMWHQNNYRLFKANEDSGSMAATKFNNGVDNFVHRNEMVLGWKPKEEYEEDLKVLEFIKSKRDLGDRIRNSLNSAFQPHAETKTEQVSY